MDLFHPMKCSTVDESTELLNFTPKIIPNGSGYDEEEENDSMVGVSSRKMEKGVQWNGTREQSKEQRNNRASWSGEDVYQEAEPTRLSSNNTVNEQKFAFTKQLSKLKELNDVNPFTVKSIELTEKSLRRAHKKCESIIDDWC